MLSGLTVDSRLELAALLLSPPELRASLLAVAVGSAPLNASDLAHAMVASLDASRRMKLGGLLMAPDAIRTKLAELLQASLFCETLLTSESSAAASAPVAPVVPVAPAAAAAAAAAPAPAASVAVEAAAPEKQAYMRFTINGSLVQAREGVAPDTSVPDTHTMTRMIENALRHTLPLFKVYLESQWTQKYPDARLEVMSFRAKGKGGENEVNETLDLHVVAATDAHPDLTNMIEEFMAHLLREVHSSGGCTNAVPMGDYLVVLTATPDVQSVRVGAMGAMDIYYGQD